MESGRKFLRCLIKDGEAENLADNAFKIIDAPINFFHVHSELHEIYKFVTAFYEEMGDLPTFSLLESEFEQRGGEYLSTQEELKDLRKFPAHIDTSFDYIKREVIKELHQTKFNKLLLDVSKINSGSHTIGKKTFSGTKEALDYLLEQSEEYYYQSNDHKTDSEMSESGLEAILRFDAAKENNLANYGILSGLYPIDVELKGVKKKELLLIAGSTGECKTTLSLNYAYNAAVAMGFNVLYVTLEMPREVLQDKLYCMHANNKTMQRELGVDVYLTHNDVRNGELSNRGETYYKYAVSDWDARGAERVSQKHIECPYGKFYVWQPDRRLTPSLLTSKMNMLNKADKTKLALVVVDHPGLMGPDDPNAHRGETASLNEIMKRLKGIAMTFDNNIGIAMIAPFQINREGKKNIVKKAEKNAEKKDSFNGNTSPEVANRPLYNTYDLAYANEAERSADGVIYTYLDDEMRKSNKLHIGCIKSRHGGIFPPFLADTALAAGVIWHTNTNGMKATDKMEEFTL